MAVPGEYTPCITASRGSNGGFWVFSKGSRLSTRELMKLQGMRPGQFSPGVTRTIGKRRLGFMVGNAFTQTVLNRLLVRALPRARLSKILKLSKFSPRAESS